MSSILESNFGNVKNVKIREKIYSLGITINELLIRVMEQPCVLKMGYLNFSILSILEFLKLNKLNLCTL